MTLRRVQWRQGLFLAPQHFEHADARVDSLIAKAMNAIDSHAWGFETLELRAELDDGHALIRNCLVDVTSCHAVYPEGGHVVAGGAGKGQAINAVIVPRDFRQFLDPGGKPTGIYLGLPRLRDDVPNVGTGFVGGSAADVPPRYTARPSTMPDQYDSAAPEAEVPELLANLVILFSTEPRFDVARGNYELLHMADVAAKSGGAGSARILTEFVPPILRTSASPPLEHMLLRLRDLLLSRAQDFSMLKRDRGIRAGSTGSQDAVRLLILQSLSRFAVKLNHLLESPGSHPREIYGVLRELVGEFSAYSERYGMFGEELDMPGGALELSPYRHDEIGPIFSKALGVAQELVRSVSAGPEAGVALSYDNGVYRATVPETFFEGERNRFYLLFNSSRSGKEVEETVQRGKICNIEIMNQIRQFAATGLPLSYKPIAPEDLPQRGANHHYFEIDSNHDIWRRIRAARNIAVLCALPANDTGVRLLCVRQD
jgi:type VI secretion system protein ImpJ